MDRHKYINLLKNLIATPSYSREEDKTADRILSFLIQEGIDSFRIKNNIVSKCKYWSANKPTLVLNSHHDTVKTNNSWTYDPFKPTIVGDQLFGLGSNDAGASLIALIATYIHFYDHQDLQFNLAFIAAAEEENSGPNGIRLVLKEIDFQPDLAVVGEPTEMQMAIAEKGLLVIDGISKGSGGHAAHPNNENAIYQALEDIQSIRNCNFSQVSSELGPVLKSVTQINAGSQHNVVPDECTYVVDVRVNELYTLNEVFKTLQSITKGKLTARSFKNNPSLIDPKHPIVTKGLSLGLSTYGSPTLSDQAHFNCPSIKIGPGKSTRSHQPDEFILLSEIDNGIEVYIKLLDGLKF